ncbi:MAG: hypothetical protein V1779_08740 [bacterium]
MKKTIISNHFFELDIKYSLLYNKCGLIKIGKDVVLSQNVIW